MVEVAVPSLRERGPAEVNRLAEHFLSRFSARYARPRLSFSPRVQTQLRDHAWPGNVCELEHWVASAVVPSDGPVIERATPFRMTDRNSPPRAKPTELSKYAITLPLDLTLAEMEARYADAVLRLQNGNKTEVTKRFGAGRNTV